MSENANDEEKLAEETTVNTEAETQETIGGGTPSEVEAQSDGTATAKPAKKVGRFDKFFGITAKGSSFSVEIFAGLTTFLAMCYILTVNPTQILQDDAVKNLWPSVFLATALGALIGTLLMALFAKMPLAQAPGMGLNAALGGIIGGGTIATGKVSFGVAMLLVLISGVIFLLLTVIPCGRDKKTGKLIGIREKIFESIPAGIRTAIPVGIGLFIAFIGFQNSGLIVTNGFTQVGMVDFTNWGDQAMQWGLFIPGVGQVANVAGPAAKTAIVALISLIVIAILSHYKIKGAVIIGMLAGTIVAMPLGVVDWGVIAGNSENMPTVTWKFWESFQSFFSFDTENGGVFGSTFHGLNFNGASVMFCIVTILSFCMIDMFDTMGTVIGCCAQVPEHLLDKDGKPHNFNKIMLSDSIATCAGAILGTSTVTTFVESSTGVAAGGRTGFSALITSTCFLVSIFLLPVFAFIPSSAAAGALIYVGVLMMSQVKNIDFSNLRVAVPAFLTIIIMPLGYSITKGIGVGMLSYVIINIICYIVDICVYSAKKKGDKAVERPKWPISITMGIIAIFFALYFFLPTNIG